MLPAQSRIHSPQALWPAVGRQERDWGTEISFFIFTGQPITFFRIPQCLAWRPTAGQRALGRWVRDWTEQRRHSLVYHNINVAYNYPVKKYVLLTIKLYCLRTGCFVLPLVSVGATSDFMSLLLQIFFANVRLHQN